MNADVTQMSSGCILLCQPFHPKLVGALNRTNWWISQCKAICHTVQSLLKKTNWPIWSAVCRGADAGPVRLYTGLVASGPEEGSLVAARCTGGESNAISGSALGYQPPSTTWPPSFLQQMWQSSPTAKRPRPDVWPPLTPPAFRLKPGWACWRMEAWGAAHSTWPENQRRKQKIHSVSEGKKSHCFDAFISQSRKIIKRRRWSRSVCKAFRIYKSHFFLDVLIDPTIFSLEAFRSVLIWVVHLSGHNLKVRQQNSLFYSRKKLSERNTEIMLDIFKILW